MKMIGMWRVPGRERMMRAVCRPSIPAIRTSSRITEHSMCSSARSACSPDSASTSSLSERLEHRVQGRQALAVIVDQQDAAVMLLVIRHAANPEPG